MSTVTDLQKHLPSILSTTAEAGRAVERVRKDRPEVEHKEDASPITEADRAANRLLTGLLETIAIAGKLRPVISEEGREVPYEERQNWRLFWLVDPLDGTKEFIAGREEYTINLALVESRRPVFGLIHLPVTGRFYLGFLGHGAFKLHDGNMLKAFEDPLAGAERLPNKEDLREERSRAGSSERPYRIVASRSHYSPETEAYVERKRQKMGHIELVQAGSSLKFCRVAEGSADVYPRFGPTNEWDIAAGHAIAVAAGYRVRHAETGEELLYNKESLLNPPFVVG